MFRQSEVIRAVVVGGQSMFGQPEVITAVVWRTAHICCGDYGALTAVYTEMGLQEVSVCRSCHEVAKR